MTDRNATPDADPQHPAGPPDEAGQVGEAELVGEAGLVGAGLVGAGGQADGVKPSGLRNPAAAVRGVGAGSLVGEAIVLLLAIQPMRVLGVRLTGTAIAAIITLAVLCIVLAGALRSPWAWRAGLGIQVLLIGCGYFHVSLAILGVLFSALWVYVLSVRRSVLGTGRQPSIGAGRPSRTNE